MRSPFVAYGQDPLHLVNGDIDMEVGHVRLKILILKYRQPQLVQRI